MQSVDTPMFLNLYLLSQTENKGYETFDSCVVAAENAEAARQIHPYGPKDWEDDWTYSWASSPANVTVKWIGTAVEGTKAGVVLASYNAG